MMYVWWMLAFFLDVSKGFFEQPIKISIRPEGTSFFLDKNVFSVDKGGIEITTASNVDEYIVDAQLGDATKQIRLKNIQIFSGEPFGVSVHHFNQEVDEATKSVHFLCHESVFTEKQSSIYKQETAGLPICCVISVNTSFSHEFSSCSLSKHDQTSHRICHTSVKLPSVLWKQSSIPKINLSYAAFYEPWSSENTVGNGESFCHHSTPLSQLQFKELPPATISRAVPDAIRELGGTLLLQVPRRELRTNEEFAVSVRLKGADDVTDFTMRCEVPSNSYVEFVRVIWPGGLTTWKHSTQVDQMDHDVQNLWDIFHRSMLSQKRNITEVVARLREDLVKPEAIGERSPAIEVYKLLFRVNRPPSNAAARVAPRIFWNLVSIGRHRTQNQSTNVSPIVTRLNIEPSELTHLAMVIKTSALVNLAALTGQPSTHPLWVYGLTHSGQVVDVTDRATCQTGDDAVIHFANDACYRLGFSGAELDGSPGLPLVAKLDGRSATSTLLVWFPKPPALRLVVDQSAVETVGTSFPREKTASVLLKRMVAVPQTPGLPFVWTAELNSTTNVTKSTSPHHSHLLPVRVLARFILASSVLYGKDVLGGSIDQYVDVTRNTAHRLRIETNPSIGLVSLKTTGQTELIGTATTTSPVRSSPAIDTQTDTVWLYAKQTTGKARLYLDTIDRDHLLASIPPGLEKQLKDQHHPNDPQENLSPTEERLELDVMVSQRESIWPVGLSAQLISDFKLSSSSAPSDISHHVPSSNPPINSFPTNTQSYDETAPVYSNQYSIRLSLIGGQLTHIGSVPDQFLKRTHHLPNDDLTEDVRTLGTLPNEKRLLIVWIHLSDGTSVYWNRVNKLYKTLYGTMPFELYLRNLRPDIFRIIENIDSRLSKRSAQRSRNRPNRFFRQLRSSTPMSGGISSPESGQWDGPVVELIRSDVDFTGDVLEVGLQSRDGKLILPTLKLNNVDLPKTTTKAPSFNSRLKAKSREGSLNFHGLDTVLPPPTIYPVEPRKTFPHQDAPRFQTNADYSDRPVDGSRDKKQKLPIPRDRDDTSLSDQTIEQNHPALMEPDTGLHANSLEVEQLSSRSILETSMYVLLGLFALVGLVFAVNCGAVVARYRWERARQQQQRTLSDTLISTTNAKHTGSDEAAADSESKLASSGATKSGNSTDGVAKVKKYTELLLGRAKNKPTLHKDDNWVWISRDKTLTPTEQNNPSWMDGDSPHSSNDTSHKSQSFGRSHSCGNHPNTTAVLSVGEADMLLLHSPYRQFTWQDRLNAANETHSLKRDNPWHLLDPDSAPYRGGIQSLRRPTRRHTTGGPLTQRNYQGQECSIRIISNPPPVHPSPNRDPSLSKDMNHGMVEQNLQTVYEDYSNSHVHMGTSSVSMRRRRRDQALQPYQLDPSVVYWGGGPVRLHQPFSPPASSGAQPNRPVEPTQPMMDSYWDPLMYRSWVRPSTSLTANKNMAEPTKPLANVGTPQIPRRPMSLSRDTSDVTACPKPPERTTSRMNPYHTVDLRKASRNGYRSDGPRPLSLPQNFQVSNELYSALVKHNCSTETTTLLEGQPIQSAHMAINLPDTTSEESLWWYHPVRTNNGKAPACQMTLQGGSHQNRMKADTSKRIREIPEYECPAACDCIPTEAHPKSCTMQLPADLSTLTVMPSASDLAWDKDLLGLSHDRLVAYFAGLRESMA